ncbi:MAG: shikimate dehydrogenase [Polyangiaceae bacterium]|nr:shikimate dehydrogenase [Myxococcales bacterium]MCB9585839.1 shikimate dehydrogenase [Polyangiaceae bacterium]MCB9607232.1 shikimate dehydrogenase [Polyangiaceae bacterium]
MHNAGYRELGLAFSYVPFALDEAQLGDALSGMRALGIRGFGVSMPFKLSIMPLLDEIDPLAGAIGAVNTVVNEEGRLVGHNTDARGALRALEEVESVKGRQVLVLGAGGAARAVAFGLSEAGARVIIVNRNHEKARELVTELQSARSHSSESAQALESAEALELEQALERRPHIVVNATSVGMENNPGLPIPAESVPDAALVMDIVYKPLVTPWLERCRERGNRVIHGGRMLLHQAARQFELYTQREAPLTAMDRALREYV